MGFIRRALIHLVLLVMAAVSPRLAAANDLLISNVSFYPLNTSTGEMQFDISWSNSWRTTSSPPNNWDAAWVFAKVRVNSGDWKHLYLASSGHWAPSSPIATTLELGLVDSTAAHHASDNPAVGVFLYRTNDGTGTFNSVTTKLRWNYADIGAASTDTIEIRLFGIEMVYVPQGAFYAGDNATSTSAFREKSTGDNDPWSVSSEGAITTTDTTTGNYYYPGGGDAANSVFPIPAAFPKGYGAFYMMKGEISQGQYVAFFNP
jgi:hypothetical protein